MVPSVRYVVGRRQAGKSSAITREIGDGESAVVLVETEHDAIHHAERSPLAKVVTRRGGEPLELDPTVKVLVLDNVLSGSTDRLLQAALASTAERVVVAVSHPLFVPLSGEGVLELLSIYGDSSGSNRLEMLKATYEFRLAANVHGVGKTAMGTGPLCKEEGQDDSMSQ